MAAKKTAPSRKKQVKTPEIPLKERAVFAALDLAGRMGWDMVTLTDIADKLHIGLAELAEMFDDKTDILVAYGKMIDKKVLNAVGTPDPHSSTRDRLFEILMERFDVIGAHKDAVSSILKSFVADPKQAVISLPHLGKSMCWMLEAAGIETNGVKGAVRVAGLCAVYLATLKTWMGDESADLSKTMAALDKHLSRAERCANSFML